MFSPLGGRYARQRALSLLGDLEQGSNESVRQRGHAAKHARYIQELSVEADAAADADAGGVLV
jgi:hypothetical protein